MIFDLPVGQQRARSSLIRWLRSNGFGYLQDSVWISPDPVDAIAKTLKPFRDDAASFTVLRCQCESGFANASLVVGAWPFEGINEGYRRYIEFASAAKARLKGSSLHPRDLFELIRKERKAWADAFDLDPLLPMPLWPKQYEGHRAWEKRRELMGLLQRHVPVTESSK
jgi:phenylacetic acid degradation operon negative regulatory protein